MKLYDLVPNSCINVSVSYLYIPRIGLPVWLQQNRQTDPGNNINRSQIHECGNCDTEHYNSVLEITRPHSLIYGSTLIGTRHYLCCRAIKIEKKKAVIFAVFAEANSGWSKIVRSSLLIFVLWSTRLSIL